MQKTLRQGITLFLIAFLVVSLIPAMARADSSAIEVSNLVELQDALNNPACTEVILLGTLELPDGTDLDGQGKTIRAKVTGTDESGILNIGASNYSLFSIEDDSAVSLKNMTLKGGAYSAILNKGTLTIDKAIITQSGSASCLGGAVYNSWRAVVVLTQCELSRNVASVGGSFFNSGVMVMDACSINENRNIGGGMAGGGGGESGGSLYANNCTFANNQGTEIGGALNLNGTGPTFLLNSAVVGNLSTDPSETSGGGVGLNGNRLIMVNSLALNNYYDALEDGEITDISVYESTDYHFAFYSAFGVLAGIIEATDCQKGIPSNNETKVFNSYISSPLLESDGSQTETLFLRPRLVNGIAPLSTESVALTGGTSVYFNYSDLNDIKVGYGTDEAIVSLTLNAPTQTDKVSVYQDQAERLRGVMGPIGPSNTQYCTVTVQVSENGQAEGGSIFGDTYAMGASVTLTALPDQGYWFDHWETPDGTEISNDRIFTFAARDIILKPVFLAADTESRALLYDANGAEAGTVPSPEFTDLSTSVLVAGNTGALVRTNYSFDCWNTAADGSGDSYLPGSSYKLLSSSQTLYAQWKYTGANVDPTPTPSTPTELAATGDSKITFAIIVFIAISASIVLLSVTLYRRKNSPCIRRRAM